VGFATTHHADITHGASQRTLDGGHVEFGVVCEDAHCVAGAERGTVCGEHFVGPGDHDVVSHRKAPLGGEHLARVAHRDAVAEHLRHASESAGEIHGAEDHHVRRRGERLNEHAHGCRVAQVFGCGLALRAVVARAGATRLEFPKCIAPSHAVELGITQRAEHVAPGRHEHRRPRVRPVDHHDKSRRLVGAQASREFVEECGHQSSSCKNR